jgi:hypothetical protein
VFDWEKMRNHEAYQALQMEQYLNVNGSRIITTRCPVRIDGKRLYSGKPAPKVGADTQKIKNELVN